MNNKTLIPPIKCQGKKTKLIPFIHKLIPQPIHGQYIEPFLGSGVVAFNLKPERAILSDLNPHIIQFYKSIQNGKITPILVRDYLEKEGKLLENRGEDYYYKVRERFNKNGNPLDFLFLSRSCFNGMIRFNKNGGFNVPFCHKPKRFSKAYITRIVNQVQKVYNLLYNNHKWELRQDDYKNIILNAKNNDLIYCDPPYIGRHVDYYDSWDEEDELTLYRYLKESSTQFILSTWHSNKYRTNHCIDTIWKEYPLIQIDHFYHVGGYEKNRNSMTEGLVYNIY